MAFLLALLLQNLLARLTMSAFIRAPLFQLKSPTSTLWAAAAALPLTPQLHQYRQDSSRPPSHHLKSIYPGTLLLTIPRVPATTDIAMARETRPPGTPLFPIQGRS